MTTQDSNNKAGSVSIDEVFIISRNNVEYNIKDIVIEINLFEDMYQPCLTGNVQVSDGHDLINLLPIVGEELIRIKLSTPSFPAGDCLYKTFKIYAITDKTPVMTDTTQVFTIHFISQEGFLDSAFPIQGTFTGNVNDVASSIFNKYIQLPRNTKDGVELDGNTELLLTDTTKNVIQFNSPNWTAFKCINYVAARSLRTDNDGSNFVFFETNKTFVFGSVQELIDMQVKQKFLLESYKYSPPNSDFPDGNHGGFQFRKPDLSTEYRIVEEFHTDEDFNLLNSNMTGHLANRIITYDLLHKQVNTLDYDYLAEWYKYKHIDYNSVLESGSPVVSSSQLRASVSSTSVYPQNQLLFSGGKDTTNKYIDKIISSRKSLMADINARRVSILVNGRWDAEVGMLVEFLMPSFKSKPLNTDENVFDPFYSGIYLITCIRHKVNAQNHKMVMELCKDSTTGNKS